MGFIIEKQLTNTRPPKTNVAEIVTTPTKGNMRISEMAADRLGLKPGDYVGLVTGRLEEGGAVKTFAFKGWADEENGNQGSKLASPNGKAGGSLLFSSANTYQSLGGNSEMNRHWSIAEEGIVHEEVTYFEVTFEKETAKAERSTEDAEDEVADAVQS